MPSYTANVPLTSDALNAPIGTIRTAVKYNNFTLNNVTAYRDDPELLIPVPPNTIWALKNLLFYLATPAADAKLRITTPSGSTGEVATVGLDLATAVATGGKLQMAAKFVNNPNFDDLPVAGGTSALGFRCSAVGYIQTRSTPGNVGVRFAQNTAEVSDATLFAGSWMILVRIG